MTTSPPLPRVMHITIGLGYGGMEMMLARLIEADRGVHEHWVVGMMDDTSPDPADTYTQRLIAIGAKVFSLGFPRGKPTLSGTIRLWRLYRTCRPALLCGWSYHSNLIAALLCRLSIPVTPTVLNFRNEIPKPSTLTFGRRLFFHINAIVCRMANFAIYNSQRGQQTHQQFGFSTTRAIVIPNGFDVERFAPNPQWRTKTRSALGISETSIVCGLVARFDPQKDHLTFIKAAMIAAQKDERLIFLIVGNGTELIETDRLFGSLLSDRNAFRLRFLGHVGDMPIMYNAFDICALSSTYEGFPNVLGEAMACGVPCVSTDVGDAAFLIGNTGLICPHSDPERLAQQIVAMAASDLSRLGKAARQRIVETFSIENSYIQFSRAWQRCIAPEQRRAGNNG